MKPSRDVRSEYQKLLAAASPTDKANATYLLGRVTNDPEGMALIHSAASGDLPSYFALYSEGSRAFLAGDFAGAQKWGEKLQALDARHLYTIKFMKDLLLAQKKYAELEQWAVSPSNVQEGRGEIMIERYRSALLQNNTVGAKDARQQMLVELRREAPASVPVLELILDLTEAVIQGNVKKYLAMSRNDTIPVNSFVCSILKNDLSEAEQTVKPRGDAEDHYLLHVSLLYLIAKKHKDQKVMDQCWEDIVKDIPVTVRTAKPFIDMIEGKTPFQFEGVQNAYIPAEAKRAVLLVLADRYPAQAAPLKALAKKLNYQRDEYSMAIEALEK